MTSEYVLQTPRLRLREFGNDDVPALQAMHREPRVRAMLVDDYPLEDAAVSRLFVERMQAIYRREEGLGIWHSERRQQRTGSNGDDSGNSNSNSGISSSSNSNSDQPAARWRFCGWFNLMRMPDDATRVEIGCRLLPDAWGSGLALEGGQALLGHAFERLRLPAVWAVCHPQHRSVRAVLRALGFEDRGVQPYDERPAAHYAIDRDGWRAAAATPLRQRVRDAVRARDGGSDRDRDRDRAPEAGGAEGDTAARGVARPSERGGAQVVAA
jgi:RimJ/RimL family protein N-acetyltransferase